jgi:archaellum component FlaF (FlaF/FlaG flagellin family)
VENSIPALMIAAIMIFGGVLIASATHDSLDNVNQSWRDMEAISEQRLGTDLAVVSTSVDGTGAEVTAIVRNDGRTPLGDFEHMDVIVNYDGVDAQRYNRWVPYSDQVLQPSNTWSVVSISNDYHNPGMLDTGEELTVLIKLSPVATASPARWLVIATETGVAYTVYF